MLKLIYALQILSKEVYSLATFFMQDIKFFTNTTFLQQFICNFAPPLAAYENVIDQNVVLISNLLAEICFLFNRPTFV